MSKKSTSADLLKKKYKPIQEEPDLFQLWQKEQLYAYNADSSKPTFTIDTPPPYTNASWHLGGTIHYSQIDMIARTMRMKGFRVLFPMGLDRNGLPIEIQTEKEHKIRMHNIPREKFLQLCKDLLDKYGDQILTLTHKLGLSCNSFDWDAVYKTDQKQYRAETQATFLQMWHKGLIYEDDRPNNWDPILQTTVADAEIDYLSGNHILYDIQFDILDSNEPLIIATTRPELIPAIGTIIYHPQDTRYLHLEGKIARVPIWDIEVPIQAHPQADPNFGRGIMMICSFGDIVDIRLFRELGLKPRYVIQPDGTMASTAGQKFQGLSIKKARNAIINELTSLNKVKGQKNISHRYPVNERSKTPIEFIGMPEYYLKQEEYVDQLKQYAEELIFHPPGAKQILMDWLNKISMDWPITRRRYYGTEVPLWYCTNCDYIHAPEPGPYYQPWKNSPPISACPECGHTIFRGDDRIFDTWMDSSISAYYIQKYPHNKQHPNFTNDFFENKDFICDLRAQGKDIVRTWLHYSMLRGYLLFDKPMFQHAWISGHVLDKRGQKMSKSLGNALKPESLLDKYGGDAIRLFGALEASHGSDIRFSEIKLAGTAKFIPKLYNISRFIAGFIPKIDDLDQEPELQPADQWVLAEFNQILEQAYLGYENFDFHIPAKLLRSFTWDTFAGNYLELVKARAYNSKGEFSSIESKAACWTLNYILNGILRALAPIIPFITDYIYRAIYYESIHLQLFPEIKPVQKFPPEITLGLMTLNTKIWKAKKQSNPPLSLRDPIQAIELPEALIPFSDDLKAMHNIEQITSLHERDGIDLGHGLIVKIRI